MDSLRSAPDGLMERRRQGRYIIYERKGSGGFGAVISANGAALALFSAPDRRAIVRAALLAGGQEWTQIQLPKRFTPYATFALGYRASARYESRKFRLQGRSWGGSNPVTVAKGQPLPLVLSGRSRTGALTGAKVRAVGTTMIRITFPRGGVNFKKAEVLQRIPSQEIRRMTTTIETTVRSLIESGVDTGRATGPSRTIQGATSRISDAPRSR